MVDAVITYVDAEDEAWVKSYSDNVGGNFESKRFRSFKVLDLQISLIRKYMSFVDNIFVVVSAMSQVPSNIMSMKNIHIVLHEEIIPPQFLPCFNSCAIEMFLHNISGLKENFLYFNDDFFPVSELNKTDFFNGEHILFDYEYRDYSDSDNNFCNVVKNTNSLFNTDFTKCIKPYHGAIMCAKKSHIQNLHAKYPEIINEHTTIMRDDKNYNFYLFMLDEVYNNPNYIKKGYSCGYFETNIHPVRIFASIKENGYKTVCINDNNMRMTFNMYKEELHKALTSLL